MTTTITVKTFTNPASVSAYGGGGNVNTPEKRTYDHSNSTEYVPAQSERSFTIAGTGSINVQELPEEARDLDHADELLRNNASVGGRIG